MAPQNLAIRSCHLHCLVPKLATRLWSHVLPHFLGMPYWHYQLVLSLYLHQPESHQLSFTKVTQWETTGPIDRTPGTPGSDKNKTKRQKLNKIKGVKWSKFRWHHSRRFGFFPPKAPKGSFFGPHFPIYNIMGFTKQKRDSSPFRGSPSRKVFWQTAEVHWKKLRCRAVYAWIRKTPLGGFEAV